MALSGVIKKQICNNLVEISVEWSCVQDIAKGENTFTFRIYEDTSKCFIVDSGNSSDYVSVGHFSASFDGGSVQFDEGTYLSSSKSFTAPKHSYLSGKGNGKKNLLATFTAVPIKAKESATELIINVDYRPYNNLLKAYTNYTTYVQCSTEGSTNGIRVNGTQTVDAMERVTVGSIYGDYILGNEQEIVVTKKRDDFAHKLEWSCGTASGLVCEKSTDKTFKWTPAEALAAQSLHSEYVDITFNITTYYGELTVGTKSEIFTFTIPAHVIPSCSIAVTDSVKRNGQTLFDIYGGFVQKQSRFNIVTTPTLAYNSPIASYAIEANYRIWDEANTVTTIINNSGVQEISATVTDGRGRTSEPATASFDVIPYKSPVVTDVRASRCDENGDYNADGEYIKVTFWAAVSPVNNRNSATYTCIHAKSTGIELKSETMTDYSGDYNVKGGTFKFKADPNSSYTIEVIAKDDFEESEPRSTGGTMTTILMNWLASGCGMCFGGLATVEDTVENKFWTYPSGGFMFPTLEKGTNYYSITKPNVYVCENADDYDHLPADLSGAFTLVALPYGSENDYLYIIISTKCKIYVSALVDSSISTWAELALQSQVDSIEKQVSLIAGDVDKLQSDVVDIKEELDSLNG